MVTLRSNMSCKVDHFSITWAAARRTLMLTRWIVGLRRIKDCNGDELRSSADDIDSLTPDRQKALIQHATTGTQP